MKLITPLIINRSLLVASVSAFLVTAQTTQAVLISDDFSYSPGNLAGNNGGSGFSGAWAGSTAPQIGYGSNGGSFENPNLLSTVPGYTIVQSGTGMVYGAVGAGVSTRSFSTSFTGSPTGTTIWFSVLIDSNNSAGREGIYFNVSGSARTNATAGFLVPAASPINTVSNGTLTPTALSISGGHTVHLVVGQISLLDGASSSTIQLWFNPTSVTSVLTPSSPAGGYLTFTANFGGSLTNVGIEDYNNGSIDALRISDGNGNATTAFYNVVVPEPTVGALVLGSLSLGVLFSRTRRFNFVGRKI